MSANSGIDVLGRPYIIATFKQIHNILMKPECPYRVDISSDLQDEVGRFKVADKIGALQPREMGSSREHGLRDVSRTRQQVTSFLSGLESFEEGALPIDPYL
jgi:hypothetical protein